MSSADGGAIGGSRKRLKMSPSDVPAAVVPTAPDVQLAPLPNTRPMEITGNEVTSKTSCHHEQALKTMVVEVDAMRNLLTCQICQRLMYQPFSLICGHSYCYTCIDQWMHQKRECPGCRAPVTTQPAPCIVLRELVLIFTSRTQLLEDGDTAEEHEKSYKEERDAVAKDEACKNKRTGGLFKGLFNRRRPRMRPLQDHGDHVQRCPQCFWELEDGYCNECELNIDDFIALEHDEDDEAELDGELEDEDDVRAMGLYDVTDGAGDEDAEQDDDVLERAGFYFTNAAHSMRRTGARGPFEREFSELIGSIGDEDEDEDDEDDDEDEEENLTDPTMDGFIVNDDEDDAGGDSGSAITLSDDEDGQTMRRERVHGIRPANARRYLQAVVISDDDDDSDEGPVITASQRSRNAGADRMVHRHRGPGVLSSDSEDESETDPPDVTREVPFWRREDESSREGQGTGWSDHPEGGEEEGEGSEEEDETADSMDGDDEPEDDEEEDDMGDDRDEHEDADIGDDMDVNDFDNDDPGADDFDDDEYDY